MTSTTSTASGSPTAPTTAYELGAKMMLLDRTAEINAALFRSDFDDLQVSTLTDAVSFNVGNAASAITQGLEIDTRWLVRERLTLTALLANSHALLEGVPGLGKTMLIRTIGEVIDCTFNRIQFTPDLMPADITGTNVFNLQRNEFSLIKGPIFTSFLLAELVQQAGWPAGAPAAPARGRNSAPRTQTAGSGAAASRWL